MQTAFVLLGGTAIAVTGGLASSGASEALRESTYDRLSAIRDSRARELERYFQNVRNHVQALSSDEATLVALEQFSETWAQSPAGADGLSRLGETYQGIEAQWFPQDPRTRGLQALYIGENPHPHGARDLLVTKPGAGRYGAVHTRFHPTFHRYLIAFGLYDIFLIGVPEGRVLYTVAKEIDFGVALNREPYAATGLASVYRRAMALGIDDDPVIEDYTPYFASQFAPAAFVAAPVRRAGAVSGVLAVQISIEEINKVMSAEGLGETGQAYIVGADNTLRSDFRFPVESGISPEAIERIRRNGTAVLAFPVNLDIVERIRDGERGTEIGQNVRGVRVLRSHAPLKIGGLDWAMIVEIEVAEALAPVNALRNRILVAGLAVAALFLVAAAWISASVTRPVRALAAAARKLGRGDLSARVRIEAQDEIGQLAADFNRMSEDLQKTTVSKSEVEALAGQLISAQEDERRRVARELHDDFTQRLAAVAIEAGKLERNAAQDSALKPGLEKLKQQLGQVAEDVHGLSRRLHPAMLEELGLAAAIEAECRAFVERGGPVVDTRFQGEFGSIRPDVQLAVYRMVQEALRNVQKHSGADEVELRLTRDEEAVELRIRDNGRGFDRMDPNWRGGLGLASMEERVRLLRGRLAVSSAPGKGTEITARLPV